MDSTRVARDCRSPYDADRLSDTIADASGVDWQLQTAAAEEHHTPGGVVQPFTRVVLRRPA